MTCRDTASHPVATCKVIRVPDPGNLCLWNPESWALESGILVPNWQEFRNPVSKIRNSQRWIQNPRMSWITLPCGDAFLACRRSSAAGMPCMYILPLGQNYERVPIKTWEMRNCPGKVSCNHSKGKQNITFKCRLTSSLANRSRPVKKSSRSMWKPSDVLRSTWTETIRDKRSFLYKVVSIQVYSLQV